MLIRYHRLHYILPLHCKKVHNFLIGNVLCTRASIGELVTLKSKLPIVNECECEWLAYVSSVSPVMNYFD